MTNLHALTKAKRDANAAAEQTLLSRASSPEGRAPSVLHQIGHELVWEGGDVWRWHPAVLREVEMRVARRAGLADDLADWDRLRSTIMEGTDVVRKELASDRRRRFCRMAGRCMSHRPGTCIGTLTNRFREGLQQHAGRESKPKSQARIAVENVRTILRVSGVCSKGDMVAEQWFLVARVRWDSLEMTLLALREHRDIDASHADVRTLSVDRRLPAGDGIAPWYIDFEWLQNLALDVKWQVRARRTLDMLNLRNSIRKRPGWVGDHAKAWASTQARLGRAPIRGFGFAPRTRARARARTMCNRLHSKIHKST